MMGIDPSSYVETMSIWQVLLVGVAYYLLQKIIDWILGHTWYSRTEKAIGMLQSIQEISDNDHIEDINILKNNVYKRLREKNRAIHIISSFIGGAPFLTMYILVLIVIGVQVAVAGSLSRVQPEMVALLAFLAVPILISDILFQRLMAFLQKALDGLFSKLYDKKRIKLNKESEKQIKEVVKGAKNQIKSLEINLQDANQIKTRCFEILSDLRQTSIANLGNDTRFECIELLAKLKEEELRTQSIRTLTEEQISRCDTVIEGNKADASLSSYITKVIEAKLLFSEQLRLIDEIERTCLSTIDIIESELK